MSDEEDLEAAVAWLGTLHERTPLVIVWCPHATKRCRLGTVYMAPQGMLLEAWQQTRVAHAVDRPSERQAVRRAVLLTNQDGAELEANYAATCRHGLATMSGLVDLGAVRSAARDVLTGRTTRPGSITVE